MHAEQSNCLQLFTTYDSTLRPQKSCVQLQQLQANIQ
uniref:Uncharacterized protein n=1 Tax=Arundo donax TaxID=35708 RepID=A0A0A8ZBS7_ARUDO